MTVLTTSFFRSGTTFPYVLTADRLQATALAIKAKKSDSVLGQMRDYALSKDFLERGICPTCDRPLLNTALKDSISIREFGISFECQVCQDRIFGEEEEPEEEEKDDEYWKETIKKIGRIAGYEVTVTDLTPAKDSEPVSTREVLDIIHSITTASYKQEKRQK